MDRIPTFALLVTRLDGWYQSQVWHGASSAARLLGVRLVALVGSAYNDPESRGGPVEIFHLARMREIDGYLIPTGALCNFTGPTPIQELLERLPHRPLVSLGMELPGMASVVPDGGGMDSIAHHLAGTHGLRRFAYIGGPPSNADARRRWADWVRTLAEYGISQDPNLVETGDFAPESGREAADRILDRSRCPQAIVCANDAMALGVRKALSARGLRIPHDVLLTGYDDIEEARSMVPPLTTVKAGTYQVAFRAVELLLDLHRGGNPRQETTPIDLALRRSCGCHAGTATTSIPHLLAESSGVPGPMVLRQVLSKIDSQELFLDRLEETLDSAEYTEIDLWEETLIQAARPDPPPQALSTLVAAEALVSQARHSLDTRRRQSLQYLMRVQFQAIQTLTYDIPRAELANRIVEALQPFAENRLRLLLFRADFSAIPLAKGFSQPFALAVDTYQRRVGPPGHDLLLPRDDKLAGTWATLSLSLGNDHFGVVQVRDWNSNELFLESLKLSLTMLLSGIQKAARESQIREELVRLARRDDLTGLLNRRGLLEQGAILVRAAQRGKSRIGVVLCDLDGLKEINDVFGHADGDMAIKSLARALEDGFRQSDVIARLGGDEFAVVSLMMGDGNLEGAIARLREALERRSRELGRPWTARTSAGWMAWNPGDGQDLEKVLAQADALLYHDKRARKASQQKN
jgi:diguanylate cyclase (GGDEF)-like protein